MSLQTIIHYLQSSNHTIVFSGAGASQDAGVPDFRSPDGWWNQVDPRTVATIEALENDYDLFHAFYKARIEHLQNIEPHAGHNVLTSWQSEGLLTDIATQNVDQLHQYSGSKHVYELHGNIRTIRCHKCNQDAEMDSFLKKDSCGCGGRLRPNVVLFGEALPELAWQSAMHSIRQADLVIVLGTSLQVYPVNQLPFMTEGRLVIINKELTGEESKFDVTVQGSVKEVLCEIDELRR